MNTISKWLTAFALLAAPMVAIASEMTIDFAAPISYSKGNPNAGTLISGVITLDPTNLTLQSSGTGYSIFSAPPTATFTMTTNGGFSTSEGLGTYTVYDDASGEEYYEFGTDTGSYGHSPFTSLYISIGNNTPNGSITNLNFPQEINLANFQIKEAFYQTYDASGTLTSEVLGIVNGISITPVPLPASVWLMLSGLVGLGVMVRRRNQI